MRPRDRRAVMRLAILHAPGDEALAHAVRAELDPGDALVAPLGARFSFGDHLVLLVLWTERAAALALTLRQLVGDHASTVVWRRDASAPPDLGETVAVLGPQNGVASIASALRLAEIEYGRPRDLQKAARRVGRGVTATAIGAVVIATLGAAGAAALMLESEEPPSFSTARPEPAAAPSPDLRLTTQP